MRILKLLVLLLSSVAATSAQTATLSSQSASLSKSGGVLTITATVTYTGLPSAIGWSVTLPSGWSYAGAGSGTPGVAPMNGQTGTLDWAFTTIPASPATFSFRVNYPVGLTGTHTIGGSAVFREAGQLRNLSVTSLSLSADAVSNGVRPINLSVRVQVGTGADVLIAGVVLTGEGTKRYLVRAAGPALTAFGLSGVLADPVISVSNSNNTQIGANDNWDSSLNATFSSVGAFSFPSGSRDAATIVTLGAGSYNFQVSGAGGTSGLALVELYELP